MFQWLFKKIKEIRIFFMKNDFSPHRHNDSKYFFISFDRFLFSILKNTIRCSVSRNFRLNFVLIKFLSTIEERIFLIAIVFIFWNKKIWLDMMRRLHKVFSEFSRFIDSKRKHLADYWRIFFGMNIITSQKQLLYFIKSEFSTF